ncbi:MAG: aminotransferase class V-fold PLP-dependent enzyme [Candidatus Zixiibacteriota bacterium]
MKKDTEIKFNKARRLFPHTKKIVYFNSASYGPFSTVVKKAIEDNISLRINADKDDSHDAFTIKEKLRQDYARLIKAKKSEIGLGMNTSFGINIAARGLPLRKGDEILVSDIEFPALIYAWRSAAEVRGLKLKFIKSTNRCFDIDTFQKAITKKTKVLALSFVQFFNGYKNDLHTIGQICKSHNITFVVDGIQGMGVEPIDVNKMGIDIFSSGCQKWMLAPQGCSFFYLSDKIRNKLTHPFMSWLGADWQMNFTDLFKYDLPYFDSARRFELGYYAVLNLLGMKASVEIIKELGIKNIQRHNYALIDRLANYINHNPFYIITSSMVKKHRSSIFSFTCQPLIKLHRQLLKNKIILVRRENSIRVAVHLYNNENDIDNLISLLEKFSQEH